MTSLVERAKVLATYAHRHQKRKYTGEPYIVHPAAVVKILEDHGITDEVTLAAGWLHDVIEDCEVTKRDVAILISPEVADLVMEVTDVSPAPVKGGPNRAARKAMDCEHLAKSTPRGANIKCADIAQNTKSIMTHDGEGFGPRYLNEKNANLQVLKHADPRLWELAAKNIPTELVGIEPV
jgi:(p)ppGpp synthase/HD superfamily hydrolase